MIIKWPLIIFLAFLVQGFDMQIFITSPSEYVCKMMQLQLHFSNEKCIDYKYLSVRYLPTLIPSGIACKCDWIITGNRLYVSSVSKSENMSLPQTIFVHKGSLSSLSKLIAYLPANISLTVISGGAQDQTVPIPLDVRYNPISDSRNIYWWNSLLASKSLSTLFTENLSLQNRKSHSIPIGFVSYNDHKSHTTAPDTPDALFDSLRKYSTANHINLHNRSLQLLNMNRIRIETSPLTQCQWMDRMESQFLCGKLSYCVNAIPMDMFVAWSMYFTNHSNKMLSTSNTTTTTTSHLNYEDVDQIKINCKKKYHSEYLNLIDKHQLPEHEAVTESIDVSHQNFMSLTTNVKFSLVIHGGGIDLCPKLFEVILLGSIPIIESSVLDDSYRHFPVVIVRSISQFLQNEELALLKMNSWQALLSPYYELNSQLRRKSIEKMTSRFWWEKVILNTNRYRFSNYAVFD